MEEARVNYNAGSLPRGRMGNGITAPVSFQAVMQSVLNCLTDVHFERDHFETANAALAARKNSALVGKAIFLAEGAVVRRTR